MPHRREFRIYFWIILAFSLVFVSHSSPALANLSGSNVTFAPSVTYEAGKTSASCYIPGEFQMLCFNLDTSSPDGQDATALAMQFPSDWQVYGTWVGDHYEYPSVEHSCTNEGTMNSALNWSSFAHPGEYWAGDNRVQNAGTSCHALYCFNVYDATDPGDPPYDDEVDATVSWDWAGGAGTFPQSVCSSDGLYPRDGFPCESVSSSPPASVPVCEFVPITILPETLPHAIAGKFYTQQLSPINEDINNPDYWYTRSGSMPADFSLYSNTGEIFWTHPTVGTYTFTVMVAGPGWSEGSREYTIVVDPELTFEPDTLPSARQNTAYHQPITISGGTAPYTLSLQSGTLPAGMSFSNGAFTGTPTETEHFNDLIVRAIDAAGVDQTHTYSLTVYKEHLFTWTPTNPPSGEDVTFTAEPGFDYHRWSYGLDPGGTTCDMNLSDTSSQVEFKLYGKGEHKVCLELWDYDPYTVLYEEQWVTVTNGIPHLLGLMVYPETTFPGQPVTAQLYFEDDSSGPFECSVDWGDGTIYTGPADTGGFYACYFPPHVYDVVGIYEIEFSVTDDEGASFETTSSHSVVYLYAEDKELQLASNVLPTSITLLAHAPLGTETLQFSIITPTGYGSLEEPDFTKCERNPYADSAICYGHVVYTPYSASPPYVGYDYFEFIVSDGDGHTSEPAAANLWLDENEAPNAEDGSVVVDVSKPSEVGLYGTDMDTYNYALDELTFYIATQPEHGTLQILSEPEVDEIFYDGNWDVIGARWYQLFTYTPNPGTTAEIDTFTFHVNDTHQDSSPATMTITLHTPISLDVNVNDDIVDEDGCDDTHCSLREAIAYAQIGDTIDFSLPLPNTITLTSEGGGELLIDKNIRILGPGADQLSISAGFTDPDMDPADGYRVFHIYNSSLSVEAEISGLTIRDGRASEGGGIFVNQHEKLTLSDCVIGPANIVSYAGGGISVNYGELDMDGCTVIMNEGTGALGGAGIHLFQSTLNAINSTITGNITNNYGGGLLASAYSEVSFIHTTITGNIANYNYGTEPWGGGAGIFNDYSTVTLQNSIVAGNSDLTEPSEHDKWPDVKGNVISLGGNLIGDDTGSTGWLPSDLVGTSAAPIDPLLGLLDFYEPSLTPTFPLLEGSPAIDFAACAPGVRTDQRGIKRPQGILCDSGAFEVENEWTYLFIPLILR